jgi:hypothetical protein
VFNAAYRHELYDMPNIQTVGWVDVSSQSFVDLARSCSALIYPSASEGQAGAVITCLQAGLIPVISYESGVDVHDFGVILEDCSHDAIRQAVLTLSSTESGKLAAMSRAAYDYANTRHTGEGYLAELQQVLRQIGRDRGLQL